MLVNGKKTKCIFRPRSLVKEFQKYVKNILKVINDNLSTLLYFILQ